MEWQPKIKRIESFSWRFFSILRATIYGFINDQCYLKASALTYYTLLSIVPMLAVAFGFAKGFGFEENLRKIVSQVFKDQPDVSERVIQFAYSLLAHTEGGLIAGVGVIFLLWTAVSLMSSIEDALNQIGKVSRPRSLTRRFSDYLATMLLAPFFFVIASSATILAATFLTRITQQHAFYDAFSPLILFLLHLFPYFSITIIIACIYLFLPNRRLKIRYALFAALVAAAAYQFIQWVYIQFQIGVSSYGAIYGSFAAIPLFFIWVHTSWLIVLAGAELAFHTEYEGGAHLIGFDEDSVGLVPKRIVWLRIVTLFIEAYEGRAGSLTIQQIANGIGAPYSLAQQMVNDLVKAGILVEIYTDSSDPAFHPAHAIQHLTIEETLYSLNSLESDYIELPVTDAIKKIQVAEEEWEQSCRDSSKNIILSALI